MRAQEGVEKRAAPGSANDRHKTVTKSVTPVTLMGHPIDAALLGRLAAARHARRVGSRRSAPGERFRALLTPSGAGVKPETRAFDPSRDPVRPVFDRTVTKMSTL